MLEMLFELTKDMWYEPMEKFVDIVYNAAEIIPLIDTENCVEFGTNNSQTLLIYDIVDNRKHIKYSCSITHIFDKLVIQNVYSKDGKIYEYDFDKIYDELEVMEN